MKMVFHILCIFLFITNIHAQELQKVSLQLHWKFQFEFAGFIVAKEKGFYKDVGLDVELKEISFGANRYEMLKNKSSEFFIFSSDIIGEQLKGLPALMVASYFQRVPLAFATKPDIYFPIDLKNKKVMNSINHKSNILFGNMLYSANMKADDIIHVPHTYNLDDFISGKVDAIQIYIINELYELERLKIPYNIIDLNNYGIEFNGITLTTHKEYARQNPDIVKKFKEASTKGWQYALDNQEEVVDLILEKYNTQNKTKEALVFEAQRSENVILPNVYPLGSLSENRIQHVIDMYEKIGILNNINVKAKDLIFNHDASFKVELTPKEKAFLIKKGALKLCVAPRWMPYDGISEDKKHIGLAADLYAQISKNLNIQFSLVQTSSWNQSLEYMQQRKCDVLSLAHDNDERKTYMNFTTALMELNYVIATKSSELFIDDFNNVLNKTFATVKGDSATTYLKKTYPNIDLIEVDSILNGLKLVSNNYAFGFIDTTLAIGHAITNNGLHDLKITGQVDRVSKQSIATISSEPILHTIMQKAVDSIDEKQKHQLMNQLVNIKYEKGIDYTLVWQILILATLIILSIVYWNRKLFKAQEKTQEALDKLALAQEELKKTANTDKLTGLCNRLKLDEDLDKEFHRAQRFKHQFGIIIMDIDHFKKVNDKHGHLVGDTVLKELALILEKHSRKTDTVGRWGGEEFLIICSETHLQGIQTFVEKLREKIAKYPFDLGEQITASFGISVYEKDDKRDDLIKRADDALYKAKREGRNRVINL